jgi:hypothetical protein
MVSAPKLTVRRATEWPRSPAEAASALLVPLNRVAKNSSWLGCKPGRQVVGAQQLRAIGLEGGHQLLARLVELSRKSAARSPWSDGSPATPSSLSAQRARPRNGRITSVR